MKHGHDVKLITAEETIPLRQRVLRPLSSAEDCRFPHDHDPTSFHVGLFSDGHLASVASFVLQSNPYLHAGHPYRLRGMATEDRYRGQGLGGELMRESLEILRRRRCDLLWFNAREKAFGFYESLGFVYEGPLFVMEGIGPHKVMYKFLNPR